MPAGVRVRLLKWALWCFVIVFAVGGALFGPAIVTDVIARDGSFTSVKRRFVRLKQLKNYALWRSPEQKRVLKTLDGHPPDLSKTGGRH